MDKDEAFDKTNMNADRRLLIETLLKQLDSVTDHIAKAHEEHLQLQINILKLLISP